jgi:hypothetical protein
VIHFQQALIVDALVLMRAICFGLDFKELRYRYYSEIGFGETNTKYYSLQMSDQRIHLLAEDVSCTEFKYTNIENILTVQICR